MADKSINKSELIDKVAEATGYAKKQAADIVNEVFSQITDSLKSGAKVQISGFGTFEVRSRAARTGVKPGTNEKIQIPASNAPAFKAGKTLKDAVN